MPSFEVTADTGMFWNAGEEEEVLKTVLPMKAAKEKVVVELEDKSELEDDANAPLCRAIFDPLPFSECLYSDMSFICRQNSLLCGHKKLSGILNCIRRHTDIFRFILISLIIASYVPQGGKSTPSFEQTAETGMLSNAGKDKEVVETVLPVKATEKEGVVEPEDETEVEDNTYVNESRSVIKR